MAPSLADGQGRLLGCAMRSADLDSKREQSPARSQMVLPIDETHGSSAVDDEAVEWSEQRSRPA